MLKPEGQWWNADDKFYAYYKTLRYHYGMNATDAFIMAKKNFTEYPDFFSDMIGTLKRAIGGNNANLS